MSAQPAAYPDVVSREEWVRARTKLLAREREATHLRDAVNAERRRLPMVKVGKDYVFDGPAVREHRPIPRSAWLDVSVVLVA